MLLAWIHAVTGGADTSERDLGGAGSIDASVGDSFEHLLPDMRTYFDEEGKLVLSYLLAGYFAIMLLVILAEATRCAFGLPAFGAGNDLDGKAVHEPAAKEKAVPAKVETPLAVKEPAKVETKPAAPEPRAPVQIAKAQPPHETPAPQLSSPDKPRAPRESYVGQKVSALL